MRKALPFCKNSLFLYNQLMEEEKQTLISDALTYLRETFPRDASWIVSPGHPLLLSLPLSSVRKDPPPLSPRPPISRSKSLLPVQEKNPPVEEVEEKVNGQEETPQVQEQISSFTDLFAIMHKRYPSFKLRQEILDDTTPFLRLTQKTFLVFSFSENPASNLFLRNLQQALGGHLSKEQGEAALLIWEKDLFAKDLVDFFAKSKARLIIASPHVLQIAELRPFLVYHPTTNQYMLGPSSLLLLHPFTDYFTHSSYKKDLWKVLSNFLMPPSS
ncbi:MAG: hypothetical protein FJZ58_02425 [Chlamydiae bacterium]|nr:hypothetical protein [Chlamydiota bacterium]